MKNIVQKPNKCPIDELYNVLGKKWVVSIIWSLKNGESLRFGELQRGLEGCSKKMLSQQLELLIQRNIITNDKVFINKNNVESTYYLTKVGVSLVPLMESMIEWSVNNLLCDNK